MSSRVDNDLSANVPSPHLTASLDVSCRQGDRIVRLQLKRWRIKNKQLTLSFLSGVHCCYNLLCRQTLFLVPYRQNKLVDIYTNFNTIYEYERSSVYILVSFSVRYNEWVRKSRDLSQETEKLGQHFLLGIAVKVQTFIRNKHYWIEKTEASS